MANAEIITVKLPDRSDHKTILQMHLSLAAAGLGGAGDHSLCPIAYIAETIKPGVDARVIDIIKLYADAVKDKPHSSSAIICAL